MFIIVSVVSLIVLVLVYLFFFNWSVNVPDYMAARHYRYGKPTTEGPISGRRIIVIPTIDQLVMIDKRIQKSTLENISVLTRERQIMTLSITLIWKPINAAITIESIRPEDIEPTFFKVIESVIKNESSRLQVDEILEKREMLSKNLMAVLSETTDKWGISVSAINISNIEVVNDSFMKNMAMPKEIELERKTKLAQLEKELIIELKAIEKNRDSELAKLESEKTVGMKREEITTTLEQAKKERELLVSDMEAKLEKIKSEISLIQQNCLTSAESERIRATILAETEGLREKLKVTNFCGPNALGYEITKILPELYKNINVGDLTLFDNSGKDKNGSDVYSYFASSAISLINKLKKNISKSDNINDGLNNVEDIGQNLTKDEVERGE